MNPLLSDAFVDFLLYDVVDVDALCALPAFEGHSRETVAPWLAACRRVGRAVLFPTYRAIDAEPPRFVDGRVVLHRDFHTAWKELVALDVISAVRQLPLTVTTLSNAYFMAGNLSVYGLAGLTAGAAHLISAFGSDEVKALFLEKMEVGTWTGTMALTEPQAGSSLADVTTRATPLENGRYSLRGSKIFISGGDQDVTDNIVHLVLARIDGAPAGTKGISLFAVPKRRPDGAVNDVSVSGVIHKIGWRGLPSLALNFGEDGGCEGWLVGPAHQGLRCMFQMMNEARIMVGVNAASTASVAFHEALAYAKERKQGRALGNSDVSSPQVPLTAHADVRRMLLRQKAIVEGSFGLLAITARYADLAAHATDDDTRARSKLLLDLLTPIAKTFPAEKGFEANALAVQVHGGYGYSSEFLAEAWLRDQKLNSIHEGTTTIQGLDLLGRKVVAGGGAALMALVETMEADFVKSSLDVTGLRTAVQQAAEVTATLGARGAEGDVEAMLGHSADFIDALSSIVIAWVHVKLVNALGARDDEFARGLASAARYWLATEVPLATAKLALCVGGERSYLDVAPEWL